MNKLKLYISNENNPYINVAFEKSLLEKGEKSIFLWINEPCVVIGRNQNPYTECDIDFATKNKIHIVRRYSGGGAVYQDLGNLNYTLITNESSSEIIDIVRKVLLLGNVKVFQNGRNDLTVDGRKISGMAHIIEDEFCLYHGTCMINVNLSMLERVLTPSSLKLKSKGITSVRSRVLNLKDKNKALTTLYLIELFKSVIGLEPGPFYITEDIKNEAKKLSSHDWIYGESPNFEANVEIKGKDGLYQFYFDIVNGKIKDLRVFSDKMDNLNNHFFAERLIGITYEPNTINKIISKLLV